MNVINIFFRVYNSVKTRAYHYVYLPYLRQQFRSCGRSSVIDSGCRIAGRDHITIGENVYIGPGAVLYSTVADLYIGNYVNMGPGVTIITGDHRIDVVGMYMSDVHEKLPENDKDVVIEDDVWIGAGAIILKGVTIVSGSVIGAGAIVTRDVRPFMIYINQNKQYERFSKSELNNHIIGLKKNCVHKQL